jgi:hypothetical protein
MEIRKICQNCNYKKKAFCSKVQIFVARKQEACDAFKSKKSTTKEEE